MTIIRTKITVDASTWTGVIPPISIRQAAEVTGARFKIRNEASGANDIYTRTDSADVTTELRQPAGTWEEYRPQIYPKLTPNYTFLYVKAVTGSFDVYLEWTI